MDKTTNEAATLDKSAGKSPPINPITFDEVALAKVLSERFADKPVEDPKPDPAPADEGEEVIQDTDEKPDVEVSDETSEAPSNEEEQTEQESEPEGEGESKGVQKRIDKLTAQKKEALEAVEALKERIQSLETKLEQVANVEHEERPVATKQTGETSFDDIWDPSKIAEERSKAKQVKRWCEDNPDGAVVGDKEFSAQDIRNIKRRAEDALDEAIPAREAFLRRFYEFTPVAQEVYPFWKDRSSKEYNEARQILREMPQLKSIPEHQLLIGDFLAGRNARLEKAKATSKPVPKVIKPAPKQPSAPAAAIPQKKASQEQEKEAARNMFFKTGGEQELVKLLKAKGL